jgi:hypothetical protein
MRFGLTKIRLAGLRLIARSSTAAVKSAKRMACKIRTGAEDMPDGLKHIETDTRTKWKRTV